MSKNVLLGLTGSVASNRAFDIIGRLKRNGFNVKVVATETALRFVTLDSLKVRSGQDVLVDMFDDSETMTPHIKYTQEADVILIAPASANTIAKLAYGMADNALTTCCLAATCDKLIAPAMNTRMYENEATQDNLATLRRRGWQIIEPRSGQLACGDCGKGKLASVDEIVEAVLSLEQKQAVS